MTHLYQNKNIKALIVSVFKKLAGPGGITKLHLFYLSSYFIAKKLKIIWLTSSKTAF